MTDKQKLVAKGEATVEPSNGPDDRKHDFIPEATEALTFRCNVCDRTITKTAHNVVCTGAGTVLEHEPISDGKGGTVPEEIVHSLMEQGLITTRKLTRHETEHSPSQMEVVA